MCILILKQQAMVFFVKVSKLDQGLQNVLECFGSGHVKGIHDGVGVA
jgi:hypothetical protein